MPDHVLLTGGTGFIASHVLDALLDHGHSVVATVRSAAKADAMAASLPPDQRSRVAYAIVDDVARDGAFDEVLRDASPPFDCVIHTASPYTTDIQDPVRDVLEPAVQGTRSLLQSVHAHAPSVRRVVLTSSSAAMLNPSHHAQVYTEHHWRPVTWAEAQLPHNAYEASKVFSERAAWAFVSGADLDSATETLDAPTRTAFALAVINCTFTFGPLPRWLDRLDGINASNHRLRDLVLGRWSDAVPPTRPVFTWVDVRDVAAAHVQAMTVPAAAGRRFYVVAGHFSNGRLAALVRAHAQATGNQRLLDRLPGPESITDDLPDDVYQFDNTRSRTLLGLASYRTLEDSVADTVASVLEIEQREQRQATRGR